MGIVCIFVIINILQDLDMVEECRRGNILVSEHHSWGSVLNRMSRPLMTSASLYYDSEDHKWVVGVVMTMEEREERSDNLPDEYA